MIAGMRSAEAELTNAAEAVLGYWSSPRSALRRVAAPKATSTAHHDAGTVGQPLLEPPAAASGRRPTVAS
jgi:hypothetical protein